MRPLFILPVALVFAATSASAQLPPPNLKTPDVFVCTPGSQVIKVTPPQSAGQSAVLELIKFGTANVMPNADPSGFSECVPGPDGNLYVANGFQVVRFKPTSPAGAVHIVVKELPAIATGLAFNVDELYVSLSNGKTIEIKDATSGTTVDATPPDPGPPPPPVVATGSGDGVAFDIQGNLIVASPNDVTAFAPSQTGPPIYPVGANPAPISTLVALPRGVAVNTCGQVLVADRSTKTVVRIKSDGTPETAVKFASRKDIPQHIEVDAANRLFIVTAEDDAGTNAKLSLADFPNPGTTTACSGEITATELVVFKDLLSGPKKLTGLLSSKALGLAVDLADVTVTGNVVDCRVVVDFGYHRLDFKFEDTECANLNPNATISATAVKSLYEDVKFVADQNVPLEDRVNPAARGMRYSPLGGHVIQYLLSSSTGLTKAGAPADPEFLLKYGFFTQEPVNEPGVAKADTFSVTAPFNLKRGSEYWDIGSLDPAAGERERDFSKRVVYNLGLAFQNCALPVVLDSPLNHQNPLFNGPQNIKFSFNAIGSNCAGAQVRLSIVRVFGAVLDQNCKVVSGGENASYETQEIKKTNGAPGDNVFSSVGSSYQLNLDATVLNTSGPPAQFIATIWGQLAAPKNYCFQISKQ